MSTNDKAIHRIYLEGLSATERKVLGGIIRLAEQGGAYFQMEANPEKSDVIILDGRDRRSFDFWTSHSQMAKDAIWIDPPANLTPQRQIRRPVHWGALLELMKRITGRDREAVTVNAVRQPINLTPDQLMEIAAHVVRLHLGIAAEFIMDDVRDDMKKQFGATEIVASDDFLAAVRRQLPDTVDRQKVINEISTEISSTQQ